jgi:hypothetical protein
LKEDDTMTDIDSAYQKLLRVAHDHIEAEEPWPTAQQVHDAALDYARACGWLPAAQIDGACRAETLLGGGT